MQPMSTKMSNLGTQNCKLWPRSSEEVSRSFEEFRGSPEKVPRKFRGLSRRCKKDKVCNFEGKWASFRLFFLIWPFVYTFNEILVQNCNRTAKSCLPNWKMCSTGASRTALPVWFSLSSAFACLFWGEKGFCVFFVGNLIWPREFPRVLRVSGYFSATLKGIGIVYVQIWEFSWMFLMFVFNALFGGLNLGFCFLSWTSWLVFHNVCGHPNAKNLATEARDKRQETQTLMHAWVRGAGNKEVNIKFQELTWKQDATCISICFQIVVVVSGLVTLVVVMQSAWLLMVLLCLPGYWVGWRVHWVASKVRMKQHHNFPIFHFNINILKCAKPVLYLDLETTNTPANISSQRTMSKHPFSITRSLDPSPPPPQFVTPISTWSLSGVAALICYSFLLLTSKYPHLCLKSHFHRTTLLIPMKRQNTHKSCPTHGYLGGTTCSEPNERFGPVKTKATIKTRYEPKTNCHGLVWCWGGEKLLRERQGCFLLHQKVDEVWTQRGGSD